MTFYILMNHITTLFLSMNLLTTLSFDSEIISYLYGGSKEEVFFQITNNNRTLAIKPLMQGGFSNLLVITKERKYYFSLQETKNSPHQFIEIKDGIPSHVLSKKIKTKEYEILEGKSSLLFINNSQREMDVNSQKVEKREYFSKGVPIILNGKRILN